MTDIAEIEAAGLLDGIDDPKAREQRVELVRHLAADGFTVEEMVAAAGADRLALLPVDRVFERRDARYTSVQMAETAGVSNELIKRLWRALGLAEADDDAVLFTDADLEAVKLVAGFHNAGLGEEPLTHISQTLGQSMSRLADTLREVVGDALLEAGDSERALGLKYAEAAEHLVPMLEPLLGYVLSVHLREQIKSDVISQAELETGRSDTSRHVTVGFVDLVGFTRLGERVPAGDLTAAARLLGDLSVEVARPPVRLVKMIGDAAMLVAPTPEPLLRATLALVGEVERNAAVMPSARAGVASGEAVPQGGDWFGAPVNLASRVTDVARPASVLVTKPVRDSVDDAFSWSFAGARRLKGVRGEVPLYRVRPAAE